MTHSRCTRWAAAPVIAGLLFLLPSPTCAEITGTSLAGFLPDNGRAVFATHAPGRPDNLFVLDQRGLIQVLDLTTGEFQETPFLDIQGLVDDSGNEQGLLGLAFDPDFATNGYFYVNYTRDPGPGLDRTRVDRYQATNPTTATTVSSGTQHSILEFEQDFNNHNGGWVGFSPNDGYLYVATGDGGSGNDPNNRAQSGNTRLGKMLRVDVDGDDFPTSSTENYAVPADNPFVGDSSTLDEIWAYGLRNPWRNSFDRLTGDLWIGDVGQNSREEINFQPGDSAGGENYGWRLREGDIATPSGGVGGAEPTDHVGPVYDYTHGSGSFQGNSTVGGYVYRGPDPEVQGRYFFADSFPSQLWTFDPVDPDGTVTNVDSVLNSSGSVATPVSYGEDAHGNLYIVDLGGGIYRIETDAVAPGDYNGDGLIDAEDYLVWRNDFGLSDSPADGNADGVVDAADYTVWRDNLGMTAADFAGGASPVTVPEPWAAACLLPAAALARRRRRC